MQALNGPFHPAFGSTVSLSATSTTSNIAIPADALTSTACRVRTTAGTADVRFRSGVGNTTAAVAGDPLVPNGTVEFFGINASDTYVAVKTDAGTATVEVTFGFGA